MRQILRFVTVGVLSTLVDGGINHVVWFELGLSRSVPVAASTVAFGLLKALTYALGMIVGFYLNRRWTFEAQGSAKAQASRFATVSLAALCVNAVVSSVAKSAVGHGQVGWLVGFTVGTLVATAVSFTGHRRWTFAVAA